MDETKVLDTKPEKDNQKDSIVNTLLGTALFYRKRSNIYSWLSIGVFFLGLQFLLLTNENKYSVTWWGFAAIFSATTILSGLLTWRSMVNLLDMKDLWKKVPDSQITAKNILHIHDNTVKLKSIRNASLIAAFSAISFMLAFFGLPESKELTSSFFVSLTFGALFGFYALFKVFQANKKD